MNCPICGNGYGHKTGCPNGNPMPEKVGKCELCGDPIYSGDLIIDVDGTRWHEDCFMDEYRHEA